MREKSTFSTQEGVELLGKQNVSQLSGLEISVLTSSAIPGKKKAFLKRLGQPDFSASAPERTPETVFEKTERLAAEFNARNRQKDPSKTEPLPSQPVKAARDPVIIRHQPKEPEKPREEKRECKESKVILSIRTHQPNGKPGGTAVPKGVKAEVGKIPRLDGDCRLHELLSNGKLALGTAI